MQGTLLGERISSKNLFYLLIQLFEVYEYGKYDTLAMELTDGVTLPSGIWLGVITFDCVWSISSARLVLSFGLKTRS